MFGLNAVQSTLATTQSRFTTLRESTARIEISTEPPKSGPGFQGLDADGSGGVSYDEFWRAAQAKRNGGTLTLRTSVAQTSIQSASVETTVVSREDALIAKLRERDFGFDAAGELERALAAIGAAGAFVSESASAEIENYSSVELAYEEGSGPAPSDPETAALRDQALNAVYGAEARNGIPSLDPYERATERVFRVADSDQNGEISRSEFDAMNNVLYGEGRSVGRSLTLTATEGYSVSLTSSQTALSILSASVGVKA